jgi:hypothetical protein
VSLESLSSHFTSLESASLLAKLNWLLRLLEDRMLGMKILSESISDLVYPLVLLPFFFWGFVVVVLFSETGSRKI